MGEDKGEWVRMRMTRGSAMAQRAQLCVLCTCSCVLLVGKGESVGGVEICRSDNALSLLHARGGEDEDKDGDKDKDGDVGMHARGG